MFKNYNIIPYLLFVYIYIILNNCKYDKLQKTKLVPNLFTR